jgi:hypothetical protein
MKKTASKRKPVPLRKILMGPPAAIIAAIVGGVFSLTSALLPRVLPPKEKPATDATVLVSHEEPTTIATAPSWRLPDLAPNLHREEHHVVAAPAPKAEIVVRVEPVLPSQPAAAPLQFQRDQLTSSLAQAEAQSPARAERLANPVARRNPNLTYGVWTIFAAKDSRGTVWNNSTLKITGQQETPDGLQIYGFLDWRANGKCAGREYVVGNYVEDTRSLFIEGRKSSGCDRNLALSACSAKLSEDERSLVDGTWGSASAHRPTIPGRWEARR